MTAGWNAGTFTRGNGVYEGDDVWENDKNEPVAILASRHDAHDKILADGINACVNKDGSNAAGVVEASWLASNAVTTAKITDANVTTAKIADEAVTEAKLAADAASRSIIIGTYFLELTAGTGTDKMYRSITPVNFVESTYIIMPKAGKVTHLSASLGLGSGFGAATGGSITMTLLKNNSSTSQTLTIDSTTFSGTSNSGAITAQSFVANDYIDINFSKTSLTLSTSPVIVTLDVWGHFTA